MLGCVESAAPGCALARARRWRRSASSPIGAGQLRPQRLRRARRRAQLGRAAVLRVGRRRSRPARSFRSTASRCHSDRAEDRRPVAAERRPGRRPASHAELWEKVVQKLHGGMMPPQGMPRPDAATLDAFVTSLESALDRQAAAAPEPGPQAAAPPEPHRVRQRDPRPARSRRRRRRACCRPTTRATASTTSPACCASRRRCSSSTSAAARKISSLAVGTDTDVVRLGFRVPPDDSQEDHVDGLPLGTRGGLLVHPHTSRRTPSTSSACSCCATSSAT